VDDVFDEQAIAIPADDEDLAEASGLVEDAGSAATGEAVESPPAAPDAKETADELSALTDAAAFETVEEVVGAAAAEAPLEEAPAETAPRTEAEAVVDAVIEGAASSEEGAESSVAVNRGPVSELLPPRSPGETERPEEPAEADASPPPATEAPADRTPQPEPKPAAEAPPAEPAPEDEAAALEPTELVPPIWTRLEPVIRAVLGVLNYPLRFVPPPVRPIVDWIALSLVFWVPIVWIVALFVIGR
jgi:hypothetical protein